MDTLVEIEGPTGDWATIAGEGAGDQGIYLFTDVKGLFDPPVKVVYEEFANAPGSRFLNARILRRDITFGVTILNDWHGAGSWLSRDSYWRKLWSYTADTKIHITTEESGHRVLSCRMLNAPDISWFNDPITNTLNDTIMAVVAGDPWWYESDVVYPVQTKLDTRYDVTQTKTGPVENLTIAVGPQTGKGAVNPTDQDIYIKWTLPGSQQPIPGLPYPYDPTATIPWASAPITTWTVPDYSLPGSTTASYDPAQTGRLLTLPGMVIGEDCVVNTDPIREQISSASGTPIWARMNGVRFRYPVPAYTEACDFKLSVSGCAPGQMATLRLPRPWSRPWGME
jgi:hypothetical protein